MCKKLIKQGLNLIERRFYTTQLLRFVPKHCPVIESDVKRLEEFIFSSQKICVVTGAGVSTESGIPDYRSEKVGLYARTNHKPIQYQAFLKSPSTRQRYWARNYIGWFNFSKKQPNQVHLAIKNLELVYDKVSSVVTQNVDSLHFKAGSRKVIELHGTAFRVICLDCHASYDRFSIQEQLLEANKEFKKVTDMVRPDGDVDISEEAVRNFRPPICESCGGVLKPDIVFFGDNVPKTRVTAVKNAITNSDSILVLGSSLSVFSGYRIILQGVEEGKNIAIVNIGPTRADKLAHLRISAKCGDVLPKILC